MGVDFYQILILSKNDSLENYLFQMLSKLNINVENIDFKNYSNEKNKIFDYW